MAALYAIIPAAMILVAIAVWIFFWAVDNDQFDDLDSPAHSILFDDTEPFADKEKNEDSSEPPHA